MCRLIGILLSINLTFATTVSLAKEEQKDDCQLKRYASVDMTITPGGLVLIPVTINSREAFLYLNTGITFSALGSDAAEVLGARIKNWPTSYADVRLGAQKVEQIATADSVNIGQLPFGKVEFLVDGRRTSSPGPGSFPVVGMLAACRT